MPKTDEEYDQALEDCLETARVEHPETEPDVVLWDLSQTYRDAHGWTQAEVDELRSRMGF